MKKDGIIVLTDRVSTAALAQEFLDGDTWGRYAGLLPLVPARAATCGPDGLYAAIEEMVQIGCARVTVLPLGWSGDLPRITPDVIPGLTLTLAPPLALDQALADLLLHGLEEALPDAYVDYTERIKAPGDIERRSLEFIDGLLDGLGLSADERTVAARVVHAGGDPLLARSLKFRSGAVTAAASAVRAGTTVYTDTRMLAAGINRRISQRFGCRVICALDQLGEAAPAASGEVTRSRAAFESLGRALDGALVAVGNAPTALLAVLDQVRDAEIRPACIIGMPVGFVQARESKRRLDQNDTPQVTLHGFRGGSALAAAAVNAIRELAERDA